MSIRFHFSTGAAVLAVLAALGTASMQAAQIGSPVTANGYTFVNFDPALPGTAVGSNVNGISNRDRVVGTTVDMNNNSTFSNFAGTPWRLMPLNTGTGATALGINSENDVVGTQNGTAFLLESHRSLQPLLVPAGATNAFGINDRGQIVGQYLDGDQNLSGFVLPDRRSHSFVTIHAPGILNTVNAQAINNVGLIAGYYLGGDGQTHGFTTRLSLENHGLLIGIPVADPVIPNVAGEPGATFVFSQILGVNDAGIAVGYYGDSTGSQHGFVYNTNTKQYVFLDDPAEAFSNGVEVTQITGISNSGRLAGFYTDGNGIAHSFVACPQYAFCSATSDDEDR